MTDMAEPALARGRCRAVAGSPARLEQWSFLGILLGCCLLLLMTAAEVLSDGDSTPFHIVDLLTLAFIGGSATVTHRAILSEREAQQARAAAAAETERLQAAQTANAAKSRYLANVSHEIRSPLNAIYGYAQLVERDPEVNPQEAARVIRRCAEHLTSLVEGLLDVSQIANGVLDVGPLGGVSLAIGQFFRGAEMFHRGLELDAFLGGEPGQRIRPNDIDWLR